MMMKANVNALKFVELNCVLLQDQQSRQNRSSKCVVDKSFIANHKNKGKASNYNNWKDATFTNTTKSEMDGDKSKKKGT